MRTVRTECTPEQCGEFLDCVKEAGIRTDPWYEAMPYNGPTRTLPVVLRVNRGLLSKEYLVGADNPEDLETIASYITNNLDCHDWRLGVDAGQWRLGSGCFAIVEFCAFRGGDKYPVIKLLQGFGLDQEVIDNTLNDKSEQLLGYVLSLNTKEARQLAEIIESGANRQSDGYIPLATRVALLDKFAERLPASSERTWAYIAKRHQLAGTREPLARRFDDAYQLEPSYESLWERLLQGDVNALIDDIMNSATLNTDDKIEACLALGVALEGCIPPAEGITCLGEAIGSDLADLLKAVKAKLPSHRKGIT